MVDSENMGNDIDDEIDPRIQMELETLNISAVLVNELNTTLDAVHKSLLRHQADSSKQLNKLSAKLGRSIEKAKPYYDARYRINELHEELQEAQAKYERDALVLSTAYEILDVAKIESSGKDLSDAWREMLEATNNKVRSSEEEVTRSKERADNLTNLYTAAQDEVKKIYKINKRSISRSKSYYEVLAKYNTLFKHHEEVIHKTKADLNDAKNSYADSLRNLEKISEEIHLQRKESLRIISGMDEQDGNNNNENRQSFPDIQLKSFNRTTCLTDSSLSENSDASLTNTEQEPARSLSCASTPLDEQTTLKYSLERSYSLPDVLDDEDSCLGESESMSSMLDDTCINEAMSYQNTLRHLLSIEWRKCGDNNEDMDILPDNLMVYQKHYTLTKTRSLKSQAASAINDAFHQLSLLSQETVI